MAFSVFEAFANGSELDSIGASGPSCATTPEMEGAPLEAQSIRAMKISLHRLYCSDTSCASCIPRPERAKIRAVLSPCLPHSFQRSRGSRNRRFLAMAEVLNAL